MSTTEEMKKKNHSGRESFPGVLVQCPTLTHLDFLDNDILKGRNHGLSSDCPSSTQWHFGWHNITQDIKKQLFDDISSTMGRHDPDETVWVKMFDYSYLFLGKFEVPLKENTRQTNVSVTTQSVFLLGFFIGGKGVQVLTGTKRVKMFGECDTEEEATRHWGTTGKSFYITSFFYLFIMNR